MSEASFPSPQPSPKGRGGLKTILCFYLRSLAFICGQFKVFECPLKADTVEKHLIHHENEIIVSCFYSREFFAMMGLLPADQNALFYDFNLEQRIPHNYLLRKIDQFLDFEKIRLHLHSFYSHTGRPSIDPELMIRMLLVGYCYGIRFERRLCEEVDFNLAYHWFCRLGLEDEIPNHSTFSKNRHRRYRDSDIFRLVFEIVVQSCIEEHLVKGEGFAIDGSILQADVSRQNSVWKNKIVDWGPAATQSRAVKEYLDSWIMSMHQPYGLARH